jgi:hypothetical protein
MTLGNVGQRHQIEFVRTAASRYLLVCADLGVFYTDVGALDGNPAAAIWRELGANLPNAPVLDIEYDPVDDLLAIGTMGRGAWIFENVSGTLDPIVPRGSVYVDWRNRGISTGTEGAPFKSIVDALPVVIDGGTIFVAPGPYAESLVSVSKPVRIVRWNIESGPVQLQ